METAGMVLQKLHTALPEQGVGTMISYCIEYSELLIIEIVRPAKVWIVLGYLLAFYLMTELFPANQDYPKPCRYVIIINLILATFLSNRHSRRA